MTPLMINFADTEPTVHAVSAIRPDGRVLIWTGSSGFGAHAAADYLTCPHRFVRVYGQGGPGGPTGHPLPVSDLTLLRSYLKQAISRKTYYMRRGTLVHVALSHHYARIGASQGGVIVDGVLYQDPEVFYTAQEALDLYAAGSGDEGKMLAEARAAFARYLAFAVPRDHGLRFIGVETVAKLPLPGGFEHSARLDVVVETQIKRVQIWDHKALSRPEEPGADFRFALQMLGQKAVGRYLYGQRFDGVIINAVSTNAEKSCERELVPPAPGLERNTSAILHRVHAEVKARAALPPSSWPQNPGSHCRQCAAMNACVWGG